MAIAEKYISKCVLLTNISPLFSLLYFFVNVFVWCWGYLRILIIEIILYISIYIMEIVKNLILCPLILPQVI